MSFLAGAANNVVGMIIVLGVIIFFHEGGHFLAAKAFGMRVFIFSFGFGKRLFGFKWGDTDYRISLIPLGGYVKLEGEGDDIVSEDVSTRGDGKDFLSRPRWQRLVVYAAGPAMNGVLAIVAFTILFTLGVGVPGVRNDVPTIGFIEPGSPAESAGLRPGDTIVELDGTAMAAWEDAILGILMRPDREIPLVVRRGAESMTLKVRSRQVEGKVGDIGVFPLIRVGQVEAGAPAAEAGLRPEDGLLRVGGKPLRTFEDIPPIVQASEGKPLAVELLRDGTPLSLSVTPKGGRVGVGQKYFLRKFGVARAFREACRETWDQTVRLVGLLKQLFTRRVAAGSALSGPVGIATAAGAALKDGLGSVVSLIALLSISVGVLNLFPMAPLDGGHMAVLLAEMVVRRELGERLKLAFLNAGAVLIFALIGFILYSDLSKVPWIAKLFS